MTNGLFRPPDLVVLHLDNRNVHKPTLVVLSIVLPWATAARPARSGAQAVLGWSAGSDESHISETLVTDEAGEETGVETGGERFREMKELLERYAPVFKLSETEAYFPSSIEYMLPHFDHGEDEDGNVVPLNRSLLTPFHLDEIPEAGQDLYLAIAEPHNPQPVLSDPESQYLHGPAYEELHTRREGLRGEIKEPVYGFWVEQERGVVDLWYWTYYPLNLGKSIGPFGVLGNHVSDWERLRIRTIHGTAQSADYNTHSGARFSAGTIRWTDVPKVDDRPVAFVAAGSHGVWPTPGDHVYADVLDVFKLIDVTDDNGPIWDTRDHVVGFPYWTPNPRRYKMQHEGNSSWLNFRGLWGNRGEKDCWWHRAIAVCQLVGAPPGPNRGLISPPECVVSPLSWETSTYSFYFASHVVREAEKRGISLVEVEQVCGRPQRQSDEDDEQVDGDRALLRYIEESRREDEWEIWTVSGTTPFNGGDQHSVSVPPCSGRKSAVKAYRISLCLGNGKCVSTSGERKICTYQEGKRGYRFGNAASVNDLDEWWWDV